MKHTRESIAKMLATRAARKAAGTTQPGHPKQAIIPATPLPGVSEAELDGIGAEQMRVREGLIHKLLDRVPSGTPAAQVVRDAEKLFDYIWSAAGDG